MFPSSPVRTSPVRSLGRGAAVLTAIGLMALPAAGAAQALQPSLAVDGAVEIQILNINDFHGRIGAMTVPFAGTIEQARAKNPDTVLLSAGDNQGASLFASSIANDEPTMAVLRALDLKATAAGNHEFDKGHDDLVNRIQPALDVPVLAANISFEATGEPALDEYAILEVGGLKIGVIGTVAEDLPVLVSSEGIEGLAIGDQVDAVNRVAARIDSQVDLIVAEIHDGAAQGEPDGATWDGARSAPGIAQDIDTRLTPAVDAVFTAHTHRVYNWIDTVEETGATRPVMQAGEYGKNLSALTVRVDPGTKEVLGFTGQIVPTTTTSAPELIATYPAVAEVDRIVTEAIASAAVLGEEPVGRISADLTREGVQSEDTSYPGESVLGNFVADLMREQGAAQGADIGMGNAGGVRADLLFEEDGVVTYAEAQAVMPFVNNQMIAELTGAQVRTLIEQQFTANGGFNQIGFSANLNYTYDPGAADGAKVTDVFVDGAPIDEAASYGIITYAFLATGDSGFPVFKDAASVADTGKIDLDMLVAALEPTLDGTPATPDFARRQVQVTAAPQTPIAPGATVSFALGDLDLTSGGTPLTTSLSGSLLKLDGALPATAPVPLGTFTAASGSAAVSFEVPVAAAGDYLMEFRSDQAGTVVRVPLTVSVAANPLPSLEPEETPVPSAVPTDGIAAAVPTEGTGNGTGQATTPPAVAGDALAETGMGNAWPLGLAAGTLLVGAALLVIRRRTGTGSHAQ